MCQTEVSLLQDVDKPLGQYDDTNPSIRTLPTDGFVYFLELGSLYIALAVLKLIM